MATMSDVAIPTPPQGEGDPLKTGNWSHGLCGCFDNVGLCVVTFLAPCVTFGQEAEAHGDSCGMYGCLYMIPFLNVYLQSQYRETIRDRRGIMGGMMEDLLLICCCPLCTLQQEAMEIKEIQAEEARIGAIQGGAPPGAFANIRVTSTGEPYMINSPGMNESTHQPTYPPAAGMGTEPYYPPGENYNPPPEINRE